MPDDPRPPDLTTRTEGEGETLDIPEGMKGFTSGQVLGERYQILEMLGRGGMGEVWHAFDLKLRVEVALKALRPEFFKSEHRLELLRQEVRAAREVVSPNVCRIFDLIEVEGRELVSMEYVDGATLLGVLQERGPLELKEAQDIASQFLAGLEAIHKAGLIHRDIKPENIMLTRAGRVVVMDFGLARQETEGGGTVAGTPAYMSPEQAAGQTLDARADVYAAGVVLAEMVSPEGIKSFDSRQSVWEGVRSEPAKVPDTPWAQVIQKAVKKDREGRFNSAHTLTRALEDVTLRVEGADDLHPYPGLASFTEADAEYFFGREAEVEQMWRKLEGPPRLFAIMGPSGAGKSSFIAAGLVAHAPPDWGIIRSTPGNAATSSLAGVVARETAGDPDAVELLPRFGDADVAVQVLGHWARKNTHALVVVDQFEELFTQNGIEEQRRFAELLRRFVLESNIHVLLSMRDDFAAACNAHDSLRSIFHELTVLDPPTGGNLRRAVVQPATKCGYRFEDNELIEEMLAEVEGERGALPLLAFAAARLWEKRDRETGLLTRQAYQGIGGVGGALAQHAEATIDRVGIERIPIVRELFRNLVTAEGTRAVREWDELLSIFGDSNSDSPREVLRELIDARLLTSYEIHEDEQESTRRVEIIHESLLANWPRLVRWQTQDQEGAQLRDELRQAARAWDEHGRHDDRLWTGTAYREYQLWRERYPGGLTDLEEAFSSAMISLAGRRRRRRRAAVTGVMIALVAGLVVVGSFWQRSVHEARRAEAANLVSLGQLELEPYPSATVAHAIASLELSDTAAARRLALEALWKGPTAFVASEDSVWECFFTPDGRRLIFSRDLPEGQPDHLGILGVDGSCTYFETNDDARRPEVFRAMDSDHFITQGTGADSTWEFVLWSIPEGRRLADIRYPEPKNTLAVAMDVDRGRIVLSVLKDDRALIDALGFDGSIVHLGVLKFHFANPADWSRNLALDLGNGRWLSAVVENEVFVYVIGESGLSDPRRLGRMEGSVVDSAVDPLGRFVATADSKGEIRLWSLTETSPPVDILGPAGIRRLEISPDGFFLRAAAVEEGNWIAWIWALDGEIPRFLRRFDLGGTGWGGWSWSRSSKRVARFGPDQKFRLWTMDGPAEVEPIVLSRGDNQQTDNLSFNPGGDWLATSDLRGLAIWPLGSQPPLVTRRHDQDVVDLEFAPDGSWLASSSLDGTVKLWPLDGEAPPLGRTLIEVNTGCTGLAVSPDGENILVGTNGSGTRFVGVDGEASVNLEGFVHQSWGTAISPDGRFAAAAGGQFSALERVINVWDIATGEVVTVLQIDELPSPENLFFTPEGDLLSTSQTKLLRWKAETWERETLYENENASISQIAPSADFERVLMITGELGKQFSGIAIQINIHSGTVLQLEKFGNDVASVALDPTGTVAATGHRGGEIRVGRLDGGEPHLLLGHDSTVWALEFDPQGLWIASGGIDGTVRLWPMPDLSKPPLHTLPREELIAKLKTLTNLHVVRDEDSSTGWKLTHDPFPGWETVPTW